ncbi:MAG: GTP-binding protein [Candidatus Lokiarchaeota archaeon]|nr:GTP-binding protein [Candidatus Lokiarchaeota archaeon]
MFIFRNNELLYYRHFGKALKQKVLDLLVEDIINEALRRSESKIDFHDYYKYRVSYITEKQANLIFLFVTSLTDKFENIKKELVKCKNEFLNIFEDILQHHFDAKTFEVFDPTIDSIHRNLRPKISLVGFSGVGKTTITKLIKADEIPMQHIPTITGDIATIRIGKLHFHLWDFAGQEQFSYLWNNFIKGSDAVLLITNSTLENVEKSKYFLELIKEQAPNAQSAVIGNKQDLGNAMNPVQIENVLGLKTYSMIALEPQNRDKMIQIIADVLEMSAEVSPLLKPLLERDKLTEEAVNALKNADFNKAAFLFDKISDLCIELGDDSLGREFYEKSQKIKEMLKKIGAPPPTPASPISKEEPEQVIVQKEPEKIIKPIALDKPPIFEKPVPPKEHPQGTITIKKSIEIPKKEETSDILKLDTSEKSPEPALKIAGDMTKSKEPIVSQEKISLKLNPEDFMVKARPKSVEIVPEDAKSKLKISPYGQAKPIEKPKVLTPVSPLRLMEQKQRAPPPPPKTPEIQKKPLVAVESNIPIKILTPIENEIPTKISEKKQETPLIESKQEEDLKKSLLELKIKKANLTKMALDFDMKELTGEITKEELQEKKSKINELVQQVDRQIQELQKLLND